VTGLVDGALGGPLDAPTRDELRAHLVASRIAGDVATSREDNLMKYGFLAAGMTKARFGLSFEGSWGLRDILELMAKRVGVSPDGSYLRGPDRIDPELTLDGLDRMASHLSRVARRGARVVVATGHPAGLLPVHLAAAAALRAAGATVLTPGAGWGYETNTRAGRVTRTIRYVQDVAMVSTRGELNHTHSARPMEAVLEALASAGEGPPDLVLADHGWAGAAGEAGVTSVGFADSNDPALFIGEDEGKVAVSVPLDDNVQPHLYKPVTAYLLAAAGLS
jgi:hypothetical protein